METMVRLTRLLHGSLHALEIGFRRSTIALIVVAALVFPAYVAGPAAASQTSKTTSVTLLLDFLPNPVHIGIYQALADGTYARAGLHVTVQIPGNTTDPLKLMAAGKVDFAIVSLLDLLTAYQQGQPVEIIQALEQRPLECLVLLKSSGITRPRQLEGKLVGVTGVPSDTAAVKAMVQYDGGNWTKVHTITIGFNAVADVLARKVSAAIGFWNAEGVQLASHAPARVFRLYQYGAPSYPELVVFTRKSTIQHNSALVRSFVHATLQGYHTALAHPDSSLHTFIQQTKGVALANATAQFQALRPAFTANAPRYGYVNLGVLARYLVWARKYGLIDLKANPSAFATDAFVR
jgi:ABC-type nitrate/sulfonate/bicarbonate transport system substrate-binding protein